MADFYYKITEYLSLLPLWGVMGFMFLSAVIQQFFPPYPSDILLLTVGCLSADHNISGLQAFVAYAAGTALSSLFLFYLSKQKGAQLLKSSLFLRIFPRRFMRRTCVIVHHYGIAALIFCKFLPGMGTVGIFAGGIMGLKGFWVWLTVGLSGIVFNAAYFILGFLLSRNLTRILSSVTDMTLFFTVTAVCLSVMIFLVATRRRYSYKKRRSFHGADQKAGIP